MGSRYANILGFVCLVKYYILPFSKFDLGALILPYIEMFTLSKSPKLYPCIFRIENISRFIEI
jgi:hypothetical protein